MNDNEINEVNNHFGLCPVCHRTDGYANAGKSHIFFCKEHQKSWFVGANLFSSWRDQTEEEQRRIWDEIGLEEFERVKPYHRALVGEVAELDDIPAAVEVPF